MRTISKSSLRTRDVETLAGELEALVCRFNLPERRDVRRLVRSSARFADLAIVFPGALYALASRRGAAASRLQAMRLVEEGAPLKAVARALNLPLWLRRLPPEAFIGRLGTLPMGETFARRIAARIPHTVDEAASWLETLVFANEACNEDFALWLAEQQQLYTEPAEPERLFAVLAAYAWFSGKPMARANGLIVVQWRPEIGFDTALCAAKSWLNRLRLVMQLDEGVLTDAWLDGGSAMGIEFVALLQQKDILEESQVMQNCADQYSDRLARDKCRLFSLRRDGERIATLEIGPHPRETGVLTVTQLKARHNMPAPLEIWQAAHAWLATQMHLRRLPIIAARERPLKNSVWDELLKPYRQEKSGAPWLPQSATLASIAALDADIADLARRGGVSSWLFT